MSLRVFCIIALTVGMAAPLSAQDPSLLYSLRGAVVDGHFGASLAAVGDIDDDGAPDFAVGSDQVNQRSTPLSWGQVDLVSGKTGRILKTWTGAPFFERFGQSVIALQDLDGDGKKDLAVCDGLDRITIFSTGTGKLLKSFSTRRGDFGSDTALAPFPDIDGDGVQEILVGQRVYYVPGRGGVGRAALYSCQDGHLIWERIGDLDDGFFGNSPAVIEDIDGDGVKDLAVGETMGGAPRATHPYPGNVYFLSGRDGHVIRRLPGDLEHPLFGFQIINAGDLDGDGMSEVAISAPGYGEGQRDDLGWVGIFSTRTFQLLRSFKGIDSPDDMFFQSDFLGNSLGSAGDADGDGVPDLLLGTLRLATDAIGRSARGRVELRSGRTGALLAAYEADKDVFGFGFALAGLGDVDGDGRSEFLIGSPYLWDLKHKGQVSVVQYRPASPRFIRGDVNRDGRVDLTDAIALLGVLYDNLPPGPCLLALDVNENREVEFYDAVALIRYFFLRDYAPGAPFPDCGSYASLDRPTLECDGSTCDG